MVEENLYKIQMGMSDEEIFKHFSEYISVKKIYRNYEKGLIIFKIGKVLDSVDYNYLYNYFLGIMPEIRPDKNGNISLIYDISIWKWYRDWY